MLVNTFRSFYQLTKLYLLKQAIETSDEFYSYLVNTRSIEAELKCYLVTTERVYRLSVFFGPDLLFHIGVYNNLPVLIRPIGSPRSMTHSLIEPIYATNKMSQVISNTSILGTASLQMDDEDNELTSLAVPMLWNQLNIKSICRLMEAVGLETQQNLGDALHDLYARQQQMIELHHPTDAEFDDGFGDDE